MASDPSQSTPSRTHPDPRSLNVRDEFQTAELEAIRKAHAERSFNVEVACINAKSDANLGMIVRLCGSLGVPTVHVVGRRKYNRKPALGMYHYIDVQKHAGFTWTHAESLDSPMVIEALAKISEGRTLVFCEQAEGSDTLPGFRSRHPCFDVAPPLFVFGNEGVGIPPEVMAAFPSALILEIPQAGIGRSYNIVTAATMILWEYLRTEF